MKIYNLVSVIPYICLVDEFQEHIYANKKLKKEDMRKTWLELSEKYKLDKNYCGHINLETGGYFYRQSYIMLDPFYYIDYALSYFGSFAIFDRCENDMNLFENIGSVASYYPFKDDDIKDLSKMLEDKLLKYKLDKFC